MQKIYLERNDEEAKILTRERREYIKLKTKK